MALHIPSLSLRERNMCVRTPTRRLFQPMERRDGEWTLASLNDPFAEHTGPSPAGRQSFAVLHMEEQASSPRGLGAHQPVDVDDVGAMDPHELVGPQNLFQRGE